MSKPISYKETEKCKKLDEFLEEDEEDDSR